MDVYYDEKTNEIQDPCIKCGKEIGNDVFTVCDNCWDKDKEIKISWNQGDPLPLNEITNSIKQNKLKNFSWKVYHTIIVKRNDN